jgi:hypothetical protein
MRSAKGLASFRLSRTLAKLLVMALIKFAQSSLGVNRVT